MIPHDPDRRRARSAPFVVPVLVLLAAAVARLAFAVEITTDERLYLSGGRILLREPSWEIPALRFQGPLPLYLNQTWLAGVSDAEYAAEPPEHWLPRARLGMLPFALAGAFFVWRFARSAHGRAGAALALGCFALHPLVLGYAGLLNVDAAHAALSVLAVYLGWRQIRRPTVARTAALGVAIGALLATKYLAIPTVAVLFPAAVLGAAAAGGGARRRVLAAVRALAVLVITVSLALHAAYAFRGGPAPTEPSSYESELVRGISGTPALGAALALLPAPWVQGIDMMARIEDRHSPTFLGGRLARSHPGYYARSLLSMTPELLLAAWALGLARAAVALLGRPGRDARLARGPARVRPAERAAALLCVPAIAVPFLWLSLFASIQVGVRYVLQLVPLLCVLAGGATRWLVPSRRFAPAAAAVGAALALLVAVDLGAQWPNLLSYFNRASGGPERAYLSFRDANADFGQLRARGLAELRAREEEPFAVVTTACGPRLGRVAIYVSDLTLADPEDPSRSRHWLDPFEPVAHAGSAWYLFDVGAEEFARAARESDDPRVRRDLVVALAGAGRFEEAEEERGLLPPELADPLGPALEALRAPPKGRAGDRIGRARTWLSLGREDRAAEVAESLPEGPARSLILADCHLLRGEAVQAARLLDDPAVLVAEPRMVLVAAEAWIQAGEPERAIDLLEARGETLGEELEGHVPELLRRARERAELGRAPEGR